MHAGLMLKANATDVRRGLKELQDVIMGLTASIYVKVCASQIRS